MTPLRIAPLSDSEERRRAAGVRHRVQRGAAEALLSPVHRDQHGRPAGDQVRITRNNQNRT